MLLRQVKIKGIMLNKMWGTEVKFVKMSPLFILEPYTTTDVEMQTVNITQGRICNYGIVIKRASHN
jgi:alpha-D-ribose 1-methylphosphonate 5-triphosphate synthase subunit PhnL